MKALVVEGGAMRGIFAAGVLDRFIEEDYYEFDFAIGVSAGASNLVGYLSKQHGRSQKVICELATDKAFFNPKRFVKGGNLVDVKWLVAESNKRFPLDDATLFSNLPLIATTTNIETGNAEYYQVNTENITAVLEATSALPIAYKVTPCFSGGCYTDGGVADSIPVIEAYRQGANEITVILSHPLSYEMPPMRHSWLMDKLLAKQPMIAKAMAQRASRYNQSLEFIRNPPTGVTVRVIAPDDTFNVKRLTMNHNVLMRGYEMGKKEGAKHIASREGRFGLTKENCHFCF